MTVVRQKNASQLKRYHSLSGRSEQSNVILLGSLTLKISSLRADLEIYFRAEQSSAGAASFFTVTGIVQFLSAVSKEGLRSPTVAVGLFFGTEIVVMAMSFAPALEII